LLGIGIAWPSLHPPASVKRTGLKQTRTPSISRCLFSTRNLSISERIRGCQQDHHPRTSRHGRALCVFRRACSPQPRTLSPFARFAPFFPAPLRCIRRRRRTRELGSVIGSPERGRRSLEPRTAWRLLQQHFITTHGHVRERLILALDEGCLHRVSLAPRSCDCCAKEASCSSTNGSKTEPAPLAERAARSTCRSKGRAKVASHVPEGALSCFVFGVGAEASSISPTNDVLQSPPLLPPSTFCRHCGIRYGAECPFGMSMV
jgi:hypothetical protein